MFTLPQAKPYLLLAAMAALVAAFIATGTLAYQKGSSDTDTAWKLKEAEQELQVRNSWIQRYGAIIEAAETQRKNDAKSAEERAKANAATDRKHTELLLSLQHRPSRDSAANAGVPQAPGNPSQGADGSQLYRQDGLFLTGEATLAERHQSALRECYRKLDDYAANWAEAMKKSAP